MTPERTPTTARALYDAARSWGLSDAAAVLWVAHSATETGWWRECWCWNLGNVKATGDVSHCLRPCGENLPIARAEALVAESPGLATIARRYTNASGVEMAAVDLVPPHPWCRFRAYASLAEAVDHHLRFVQAGYAAAWRGLLAGDAAAYCAGLKAGLYFTAELEPYLATVRGVVPMVRAQLQQAEPTMKNRDRLVQIFTPQPGESLGNYVARAVRSLDGAHPERDGTLYWLAEHVEGDVAALEMYRTTNCATSMRWILAWLGCPHPWCYLPDAKIRAIDPGGPVSWQLRIWRDLGASIMVWGKTYAELEELIGEGWPIHYDHKGILNSDHVEWCLDRDLGDPEDDEHGGGGRAGNYITVARGDVVGRVGRKPHYVADIEKLIPGFVIGETEANRLARVEQARLNGIVSRMPASPLEGRAVLEPPSE